MKNKKLIIIATIFAIVIAWAFTTVKEKMPAHESEQVSSGKFIEKLQGKTSDIAHITLRYKAKQLDLKKINDQWVIESKYNYPVDMARIRNIITGAESLEKIGKKTDNPARFDTIGLIDPSDERSTATRVIMTGENMNDILADFIKGNAGNNDKTRETVYVRKSNENQSWLAKGNEEILLDAGSLLSYTSFKIAADRISHFEVRHPDNQENFVAYRLPETKDFHLVKPEGKKENSSSELNYISTMMDSGFILLDVQPAENIPFPPNKTTTALIKTYDGMELEIQTTNIEGINWIRMTARTADSADEYTRQQGDSINKIAEHWTYEVGSTTGAILTTKLVDIQEQTK